jgi:hypothetical protein
MSIFFCVVLSCVGRGLSTGRPPSPTVLGVVLNVEKGPKSCQKFLQKGQGLQWTAAVGVVRRSNKGYFPDPYPEDLVFGLILVQSVFAVKQSLF